MCPRCRGQIVSDTLGWVCLGCTAKYEDAEGFVDFLPEVHEPPQAGVGAAMMERPWFARIYEKYWRPFYTSVSQGESASLRAEVDWFDDQFSELRGGTCMDLSCGPGVVGRRLLKLGRFDRVFGLDYSAAMLRQCLDNSARRGVRDFDLVRGDAARLPIRDASLRAVHAGNALHLWPEAARSVQEVRRVLEPGGVFVATTFVNGEGMRRLVGRGFARATSIRFFEPGELETMCRAAGLVGYAARISANAIWLRAEAPRAKS